MEPTAPHEFTPLRSILQPATPPPTTTGSSTSSTTPASARSNRLAHALELLAHLPAHESDGEPSCPDCGGLGAVVSEEADDPRYGPRYQPCHCHAERLRASWLTSAGINPRRAGETFATYQARSDHDAHALQQVQRWVSDRGTASLCLYGARGRCKTGLAVSALTERIRGGQRGAFVVTPDLLAEIRDGFDPTTGGMRASEILDHARTVPLLVLDDLGAEQIPKASLWIEETLYRLVTYRYEHLLPLIVTTNLGEADGRPFAALRARIWERVPSRLAEMCGPWVVAVGGRNQRLHAGHS